MLNFLNQSRVIPLLMEKLIHMSSSESESQHRCKMAALWVKELAQSLGKVKKTVELAQNWGREGCHGKETQNVRVYRTLKLKSKTKLKTKLHASHIHEQLIKAVEKQNPQLKNMMSLRIQKVPSRVTKLQLVRKTVQKPSAWTKIFLPWYVAQYLGFIVAVLFLSKLYKISYRDECLPF